MLADLHGVPQRHTGELRRPPSSGQSPLLPTLLIALSAWLGACTDPVEDCTARKQADYRKAYPEARYAVALAANERFRRECQLYQIQNHDDSGYPSPNIRQ